MTAVEYGTKQIVCPDHGVHTATLYTQGHRYAGIWECDKGSMSGNCEHKNTHTECIETWPNRPDSMIYEQDAEVCDDCGVSVERSYYA
jgi:hypothetical protein